MKSPNWFSAKRSNTGSGDTNVPAPVAHESSATIEAQHHCTDDVWLAIVCFHPRRHLENREDAAKWCLF